MSQARNTISQCCDVDAIRRGKDWFDVHDPHTRFTTVVSEIAWIAIGATNAEILTIVEK